MDIAKDQIEEILASKKIVLDFLNEKLSTPINCNDDLIGGRKLEILYTPNTREFHFAINNGIQFTSSFYEEVAMRFINNGGKLK